MNLGTGLVVKQLRTEIDVKGPYMYLPRACFISRTLNVSYFVRRPVSWYTICLVPMNNFNNLINHKKIKVSAQHYKILHRALRKKNIKTVKHSSIHTSREAIKEATPIGMNTMVTIKNAEITCRESNKLCKY